MVRPLKRDGTGTRDAELLVVCRDDLECGVVVEGDALLRREIVGHGLDERLCIGLVGLGVGRRNPKERGRDGEAAPKVGRFIMGASLI